MFLFAAGDALADSRRISDGNDRPGRLDIRAATHAHSGGQVVHTISTFGRWPGRLLRPQNGNLFAVEIDTDTDRALERVVLVYFLNGRMRAGVYRLRRGSLIFIDAARASKPNSRTMRVVIRQSRLGSPEGYEWFAHSEYRAPGACSAACVDHAPNNRPILHDVTRPTITNLSFPAVPPGIEYDVSFRVRDEGGAGLRRWRLQHRPLGTAGWTTVDSGGSAGLQTHRHVSAEDADDQFRVVAEDRSGNTSVSSTRLVSVPIDNTSAPPLAYTGAWTHVTLDPLDFQGTVSTSSTANDTATLSFTGSYVAWVAPGDGDGEAMVSIDGGAGFLVDFDLLDPGPRQRVFEWFFGTADAHLITITVVSGTVPVDGIVVR